MYPTQQGQNFARLLHFAIAASRDDPKISETEKSRWDYIPDPAVYLLQTISRTSLAARICLGAQAAYTAALPAAEVAIAAGSVGLTTTTSLSGGAAGSTAGGTAGAVGGAGSTAGTTTAAAVGGSQGGTAATAGAAHGTAVAGTGAGKGAMAAKLSALGHSAGATKAATVAKVVACKFSVGCDIDLRQVLIRRLEVHHPVSGIAMLGATVYLHKKAKKDGKYGKLLADNLSIAEILEIEEELIATAEHSDEDEDLEDALDEEIDEELTESLRLTQVTTEPISTEPQMMQGRDAEAMPAGDNTKRATTLA